MEIVIKVLYNNTDSDTILISKTTAYFTTLKKMIDLNPDKKKALPEFIILVFMVLLTRTLDLISTYILTPNLDYESNPFVTVFGVKWYGFIAIQLLFLVFIIWTNHYSLFKAKMVYPQEKGLSFLDFQKYYMFGLGVQKNKPLMRLLWILKIHLGFIGYLLPRILILYSTLIIILHTMLLINTPIPRYSLYAFYVFLLFGVVLFNKLYHLAHYKIYKKITE